MYTTIRLDLIEVPPGWRKLRKPLIVQLVDSFLKDGQLQPIGVRPHPEKPEHFILVYGRHRLEAASQLAWWGVDARVLNVGADAAAAATTAENLFRSELSAGEKVIALKSWYAAYAKEHPEVHGPTAGILARHRDPDEPAPPTFTKHASATTGAPEKTIQKYVYAAKHMSEEQLGVLAEHNAPLSDIKAIDAMSPEHRKAAVAFIASGLPSKEAIATATLPKSATVEMVGDLDATDEDDMDDPAWLEHECGEVIARIKSPDIYKRDAILYRRSRDVRAALRKGIRKLLAGARSSLNGPCYWVISRFANLDHPKNWLPCGPCAGSGTKGGTRCDTCRGNGYTLNSGAK